MASAVQVHLESTSGDERTVERNRLRIAILRTNADQHCKLLALCALDRALALGMTARITATTSRIVDMDLIILQICGSDDICSLSCVFWQDGFVSVDDNSSLAVQEDAWKLLVERTSDP